MAREFVLVRLGAMRPVNLSVFDFDYDLTWAGLFLNSREKVLGRYGGRDAGPAEAMVSLSGLAHAMKAALARHGADPDARPAALPPRTVEQLASTRRLAPTSCVHCHQVYELERADRMAAGKWDREQVWVYPLPANVGLTMDVDRGDHVKAVAPGSAAAAAGLRAGDVLAEVGGIAISSIADLQYALHRAPARGEVAAAWTRGGQPLRGRLVLETGWRRTDLSWRWSLKALDPEPSLRGGDLDAYDRKELGLKPGQLAFRQGPFLHPAAERAGLRPGDVVVGLDGETPAMTARQFDVHVRLTRKVGDRVTYHVLRDGKPVRVSLTLTGRTAP